MTKKVFSLQRLAESKKVMRIAAAVAIWSMTAPAYSGGLANLVKNVTDRTTVFVYAENSGTPLANGYSNKSGVAAIVYAPAVKTNRGLVSQSATRIGDVSNSLDGRFVVADLMLARDYTANARKKKVKQGSAKVGKYVGTGIALLGIGLFVWGNNDDGNARVNDK